MEIGNFRDRVTFAQVEEVVDEYGNTQGNFVDQFSVAADIAYVRGGEGVIAARLEGHQPVIITIRSSSQTALIKPDWRAVDERDASRIFNVRSVQPSSNGDFTELLCEAGVAA